MTNGTAFSGISERGDNSKEYVTEFSKVYFREFPSHLTFPPEFPELSVDFFAVQKIQQFPRVSGNMLSPEMSVKFVPVSKFSEILLEWIAAVVFVH